MPFTPNGVISYDQMTQTPSDGNYGRKEILKKNESYPILVAIKTYRQTWFMKSKENNVLFDVRSYSLHNNSFWFGIILVCWQ